ncbi:NAD(P)/FAD-dependent oxidoreductase, partial [Brachybacterium paraconglomeratum]|uniref:NAD(P)/FAD-dependent oxidoreductase n=1 Tax=Brachybacterium paraconglomeratum TaxID=173362 RepID=UPI0022AF5D98
DEYRYYVGVAKTLGVNVRWLSVEELKEIWPLCNTDGILGAIQHMDDGYVQPAELTQAQAKGARNLGAEIHQHTAVIGMEQQDDDSWLVQT